MTGLFNALFAQEKATNEPASKNVDIWSDRYRMEPAIKDSVKDVATAFYTISKAPDIDPKNVAARYESELARWTIVSESDPKQEKMSLRRFLFNLENEEDEYEQFGWHDLHIQGNMSCLDGGNFFICKTKPNSTIKIGKDETFFTRSGIFGVLLHYGLFELYKVEGK